MSRNVIVFPETHKEGIDLFRGKGILEEQGVMNFTQLVENVSKPYLETIASSVGHEVLESIKGEEEIKVAQSFPRPVPTERDITQIIEEQDSVDGIFTASDVGLTSEHVESALDKGLRVIGTCSVGWNHYWDVMPQITNCGVPLVNAGRSAEKTTAQYGVLCLLQASRDIVKAAGSCKGIQLAERPLSYRYEELMGVDLFGKNVGVIGAGNIGTQAILLLAAHGTNVYYTDIVADEEKRKRITERFNTIKEQFDYNTRIEFIPTEDGRLSERLLKIVDYITIHANLTEQSRDLISKVEFEQMKDGVRIVNTARGEIIEPDALYDALVSGKVARAVLDPIWPEPIRPEDPYWKVVQHPNVDFTFHIAAITNECFRTYTMTVVLAMTAVIEGLKPLNAVNSTPYLRKLFDIPSVYETKKYKQVDSKP